MLINSDLNPKKFSGIRIMVKDLQTKILGDQAMSKYPKYSWVGNRITDRQMARMVKIREKTKKPLTIIVREALDEYLKRRPKQ